MADTTNDGDPAAGPWLWPWLWSAAAARSWRSSLDLAPEVLRQAINPGWTFGNVYVSNANSRAPDTEREIVGRHSYGRQLGRMMDAIELLLQERPAGAKPDARITAFNELRDDVQAIKRAAVRRRLETLRGDLAALKANDRKAFDALAAELRKLLD